MTPPRPGPDPRPPRAAAPAPPRVLLLDVDGVLRQFDPARAHAIEDEHGLEHGRLATAAFSAELALPAVRGHTSRAQWERALARRVGPAPARRFLALRGARVPGVAELAMAVQARGVTVGLLTNATDTLDEELAVLGLRGAFSPVFNSSEIGAVKPEPAIFAHALAALGRPAVEVAFIDDQAPNVEAARRAGLRAAAFVGLDPLRAQLEAWGL